MARIGVVGTGWWATVNHIPVLQGCAGIELAGICDLDAGRVQEVGKRFGIAGRYTDLAEMLKTERLDGVVVATPHVAHREPAVAALKAGCHVLIEKPMATTAEDARAIVAAAKVAGRQVMVPTGMSFTGFSLKAADWVRQGRIGHVRHCVCQMGSALADLFAGQPMVETEGETYRPPASTWADPKRAGGYGWGQLSHALGWLIHVAGVKPVEVSALTGKSEAGVDFYDAAIARAANGATIALSGASTVPKHRGLQIDIRIFGTEGAVFFSSEAGNSRLELTRFDKADESVDLSGGADYDGALPVRVFAALCRGETVVNPADAEVGARVVETLAAMYRSAESGHVEHIA